MKRFLALFLALATIFALTACGNKEPVADDPSTDQGTTQETYKIIYGGSCAESHPSTLTAYKFKELVEERSNGRIVVDVYINNTLGDSRSMLEALQANEVQMTDAATGPFASFTEEYMFVGLPFLFNNREAAFDFIDGEMGQRISDEICKQTDIRILGYLENGMRQLTNSKHPVTSPEDMKGLKIRVMESPMYIEMFTEMGASPTPMSFAELYTALQQKTVDGQDNSYTITCTNALYEVQSYMTELGHNFDYTPFAISNKFYEALPEDLQKVVDECAAEAVAYDRQVCVDMEAEYIQTIIDGGCELTRLTDAQRQEFRNCTSGCLDFFKENYNPVIPVDDILTAIDASNAKFPG